MDQRNLKVVSTNTTFIAMILLSFLQVTYAKGETCVVQNIGGEKSASRETDLCGGDEHPCHHVEQCLDEREDAFKDIVIKGNYNSTTTIKISNNVSIRGIDNAIVTGSHTSFFVEISGNKTKVNFDVTNIHFCGVGILKIRKQADVSIFNCKTTSVSGNVVWLHPEAEDIVVRLFKSVFVNISDYVLKKASSANNSSPSVRVNVDSCNFTRSKAIHLSCNSSVTVLMTSSVFSSNGSSVTVVANERNRFSEMRMINCTFQDTSMSNTNSSENTVVKVTGLSNLTMRNSKFVKSSMKCSIAIDKVVSILIKECSFYGNYITGAILLSKSSKAFISRCIFLKNSGMVNGGSIAATDLKEMSIRNCAFKDNRAESYGGDVYIEKVSEAVFNSNFFHNSSSGSKGGSVWSKNVTSVLFQGGNIFHGCFTEIYGGCIYVNDVKDFEIKGNNSFHNCSTNKNGGCFHFYKADRIQIAGRNSFAHCSARGTGGCILAYRSKDVCITGTTFTNSIARRSGGAVLVLAKKGKEKTNVLITNCSFSANQAKKTNGGALFFERVENITILHSYFFQNKARSNGGALHVFDKSNIHIAFTIFQANKAKYYGGAVSVTNYRMKAQNYSSIISKCRFQDNEAKFGGAFSTMCQGKATPYQYTIEYTMFVNNSALVLGQAILNNEQLILNRISVKAHEKRNVYHIYSFINTIRIRTLVMRLLRHQDTNQVSPISSAVFLSSVRITVRQGMNIICPVGFNVFTMNSSYTRVYVPSEEKRPPPIFTYLTVQCKACPVNKYMVARGKLTFKNLTEGSEPQIEHHQCTQCPQGAICDKDLRATDNHWGYFISQSMMAFKTCPEGYCCTKQTTKCVSYNICAYPRTGILCGECEAGFKLSFHSSECIPKGGDCNFLWFALYILMFSIGYTGTFIVVTNISDILGGIKEVIQTRRKPRNTDQQEDSSENGDCHGEGISMIARPDTSESTFSIAGLVQIIVLYSQVALMLKVKYQGKQQNQEESSTNKVFESLSNFFNFRLALYQKICPSDSLAFPQKEAILFGIKMLTFSELIASMTICALMMRFCRKIGIPRNIASALRTVVTSTPLDVLDERSNKKSNFVAEEPGKINFGHRLKMTYLKLLKLYFTPITQSALKMTHCVLIRDSYHLFVYGDLVCYKKWQIGIMTIILPGILMFPFSYDLSLRMLKKRVISSTNFVAVSTCPHYALAVYVCKYKSMKHDHNNELMMDPEEEEFARRVLEAEDLFSDKENSLNWQTIQFYRTIVMNITTIIITNPMYRYLTLAPILFLFCIHDRNRKPYKDVRLNRLQILSSRCLLLVLLCNLVASVSFTADISIVEGVTLIVKICAVVEIVLYAIVPLYLPLWKVWDILVSKMRKKRE